MGVERNVLEEMAKEAVSEQDYYELLDCMSEMSDGELMEVINKAESDL